MEIQFYYKAFGLTFSSELQLPELSRAEAVENAITITFGKNPDHLEKIDGRGILFEANENEFLIKFDQVASYWIRKGNSISIDPDPNAHAKDIRLFLLGSAMAALLHQRHYIVLHGSCILGPSGAIIISGPSASGKSSLAAGLQNRGYPVLSDDISALTINAEGKYMLHPGLQTMKIWKDVLPALERDEDYERVRDSINKFQVPVQNPVTATAHNLDTMAILSVSNKPGFKIRELQGSAKFDLVYRNIYRVNFPVAMGTTARVFSGLTRLINDINVHALVRPDKPLDIDGLCDFFEKELIK